MYSVNHSLISIEYRVGKSIYEIEKWHIRVLFFSSSSSLRIAKKKCKIKKLMYKWDMSVELNSKIIQEMRTIFVCCLLSTCSYLSKIKLHIMATTKFFPKHHYKIKSGTNFSSNTCTIQGGSIMKCLFKSKRS